MNIKLHACKCGNTHIQLGVISDLLTDRCSFYCYKCLARGPWKRSETAAANAWNNLFLPKPLKKLIDFDKIAEAFSPGQIEGFMRENNWTRECALLYLWFYNNVGINWKKDVKEDYGRGMYRKFAEAISKNLLEATNGSDTSRV
ncbi:hypothetical protein [Candidatus Avelusimicrobium fimicolum]|uniref:hypothetical protein n=1 Tax=Candidatus Avelusimicrobium fimicolum TaxID=3416216 RepID=UPI003D0DC917